MLSEYKLKDYSFPNRVVLPAMCQYSANQAGFANKWHLIHYGTRAVGKVGLIILEATACEKRGRLSNNDLGIWQDEQIEGLQGLVKTCQAEGSIVGIQLAHAGRKAYGNELIAPSALAFPGRDIPHALSSDEIKAVVTSWQEGARRAREAGFDLLQIHAAHGYLVHEFLSPLSNERTDDYGGNFENRLRFLLEIIDAILEEWPKERLLSVRLSAVDYLAGGLNIETTIEIGRILKEKGVDILDISSGGLLPAEIELYPGYQVSFAERVKQEIGIPTIAVGLITETELAQEIISNERADFVAIGRELLRNPYWVLHAQEEEELWPWQYHRSLKKNK